VAARRKPRPINGRSPEVVLIWTGGRRGQFVPARDLSGADLLRIAYRRAVVTGRKARSQRPPQMAPEQRAKLRVALEQATTDMQRIRIAAQLRPARPSTRPDIPSPAEIEALAAELAASGAFRRVLPPPEPTPDPPPTVPDPPATAPAPTEEV
jgi:hypothetical protein